MGNGFIDYDLYLRDARSEPWEWESSDDDTDLEDDRKLRGPICVGYRIDQNAADNHLENGEDCGEDSAPGREASVAASSGNDNLGWDNRMTAVIDRYESTSLGSGSQVTNLVEHEEMIALAERFMRMPTAEDPGLWKVRVWVSRFCFVIEYGIKTPGKEGYEEESLFLLHERLEVQAHLAVSVFIPQCSRGWISVESTGRENVEKLCINLSTFPHPLEIGFVPVEERVDLMAWHHTASPINSPSWVRLKRLSELRELLEKDRQFDKRLLRYANDLAYVQGKLKNGLLLICLVPRLLVPIDGGMSVDEKEGGQKKRRRRKRVHRLLHPKMLDPKEAKKIAHPLDPNVWWFPDRTYDLERIVRGVYELAKPKSRRTLRGGDLLMPPFAYYTMPLGGIRTAGVVPRLAELRFFAEGMAIGAQQLKFRAPDAEFIRWTYENHLAAPIEIGQKVEARLKTGTIRGVVEDTRFEQVMVRMREPEEEIEVEARHVRRFYDVGDRVKVIKASNIDREGLVVNTIDDHLDVFDTKKKEQAGVV